MFQDDSKEASFTLANGHDAKLVPQDSKSIKEASRFAFLSGGYRDPDLANEQGEIVKESLLCYAAKHRMGIDLGKDEASSYLSNGMKNKILEKHGTLILDDVHGLSVFQEDKPVTFFSASGARLLVNPRDMDFFSNELNEIIQQPKRINAKVKLAMELLSFSHFEKSPRSRFLTLVLAAESLLDPRSRSERSKDHVNRLIEQTRASTLSESEKSSIISSLTWLLSESISKSLKLMAETHLSENIYGELKATKFINRCYKARSQLVHNGHVENCNYDIGYLAANLEMYLTDMVTEIAGV